MTVFPVIARELRASSRQAFTYYLRVLGATALLMASLIFGLKLGFEPAMGRLLFSALHCTLFGAIWVLVPMLTADCISRERREGTLGLLFLTPLNGRDIVCAKGVAHGLRAVTLGLAVLPILTISFLLGGVSVGEALLSLLINANAMCLALAAGLVASAWSKAWLRALLLAAILAGAFLLIVAWGTGEFLLMAARRNAPGSFEASMGHALVAGFWTLTFGGAQWTYYFAKWASVTELCWATAQATILSACIILVALLIAGRSIRRSWQEEPPSPRKLWWRQKFCTPVFWLTFFRRWMRHKLERNPVGWLEQRTWSGRLVTWGWLAVMISIYSSLLTDRSFLSGGGEVQQMLAWLLAGSMAMSAAGSFRRERESGVLELLLVSPLGENRIIAGRLGGLWSQFLPAATLLLGVWAYSSTFVNRTLQTQPFIFFMVTFVTVPVFGLYFSLRCHNFLSAFLSTVAVGLLLPLVLTEALRAAWWWGGFSASYTEFSLDLEPSRRGAIVQAILAVFCWDRMYYRLRKRAFPFRGWKHRRNEQTLQSQPMTFLPIVARELRIAARRPATFWVRTGAALVILVIGTWFFLMYSGLPQQDIAGGLFYILTGSAGLFCLLSGVWFTADCLSEEKREGTLGLLFLTDLRGYDVVIGKLVASSLNGFYAVLAVVPILALPILLGGVTLGEFGRMALVIVNTLFFSLTLGICVSAVSRSPRKAMGTTLLLILFFTALLPAFGSWHWMAGRAQGVSRGWLVASAGFCYFWAFDPPYKVQPANFWWSAGVIHGLGWLFLLLASVLAPRTWQDRPAGAQALRWRDRWHWWSFGSPAERRELRQRLLDRAAYFWLAARARLSPAYVWAALGLVACGWTWGLAKSRREWLNEATYVLTGWLLNLLLKLWFGLEAGRQIAEDRRQGTLELLLSTPLSVRDILHGQWLALRRQFLGPVVVALAAYCAFAMAISSDAAMMEDPEDRFYWVSFWTAGMVMLVADLAALHWVGMWKALTAKNPFRAALSNVARILLLPWLVLALAALFAALAWHRAQNEPMPKVFLGAWVLVGLAADLGFGLWARYKLLTEFRAAATRRYAPRSHWWKAPGGGP